MSQVVDPIIGPIGDGSTVDDSPVRAPRLARHTITLEDGHVVGIAVAGHGVPLVVVHGFSAEGVLYAQTLSRLVSMGFKVIAVDTAGHGGTAGLPSDGQALRSYSELLGRVIDELGIEYCILAGHSMGGRLVTQLAAERPDRTLGVLLIDAIVGDTWDRMVYLFRLVPPLLPIVGTALLVDTAGVVPFFRDPGQATRFLRLAAPTITDHVIHPWRMVGPMVSILRSRSSRYALNELAANEVPVVAIHGRWDVPVPFRTAEEAVHRTRGVLVGVERAGHCWILRDPETFPAILGELWESDVGDRVRARLAAAGLAASEPTVREIERVCYRSGARVFSLTPEGGATRGAGRHRHPRYRWNRSEWDDDEAVDATG